jgi:hypothetical protein
MNLPWVDHDGEGASDEDMSREGWTPVVEDRGKVKLHVKIARLETENDELRAEIEGLREDLNNRESLRQPLSLDSLAAAYEAAEVADEYRAGDVLISRGVSERFVITRAETDGRGLRKHVRVLTRAPQREPWKDLADVLADGWPSGINGARNELVAHELHARGVRVTGGEES